MEQEEKKIELTQKQKDDIQEYREYMSLSRAQRLFMCQLGLSPKKRNDREYFFNFVNEILTEYEVHEFPVSKLKIIWDRINFLFTGNLPKYLGAKTKYDFRKILYKHEIKHTEERESETFYASAKVKHNRNKDLEDYWAEQIINQNAHIKRDPKSVIIPEKLLNPNKKEIPPKCIIEDPELKFIRIPSLPSLEKQKLIKKTLEVNLETIALLKSTIKIYNLNEVVANKLVFLTKEELTALNAFMLTSAITPDGTSNANIHVSTWIDNRTANRIKNND
jgi:hypothetical protein